MKENAKAGPITWLVVSLQQVKLEGGKLKVALAGSSLNQTPLAPDNILLGQSQASDAIYIPLPRQREESIFLSQCNSHMLLTLSETLW